MTTWDGARPSGWPHEAVLTTARLRLEPVSAVHADAMVAVLADPALYAVTGGEPPDAATLRRRYTRWEHPASDDGSEGWLNWVVLEHGPTGTVGDIADAAAAGGSAVVSGGTPVGTVQATVVREPGLTASVAWVIGTAHQGRGVATEAARAMIGWLVARGVTTLWADIAPGHAASEHVARRVGLRPTDHVVDGEIRWAATSDEVTAVAR